MKIFAISDTHGNLEGLDPSDSDVVVMAGDLAPLRGWNEQTLLDQVRWMNTVFRDWCEHYPKTAFRMIPGNHDLFAAYHTPPRDVTTGRRDCSEGCDMIDFVRR